MPVTNEPNQQPLPIMQQKIPGANLPHQLPLPKQPKIPVTSVLNQHPLPKQQQPAATLPLFDQLEKNKKIPSANPSHESIKHGSNFNKTTWEPYWNLEGWSLIQTNSSFESFKINKNAPDSLKGLYKIIAFFKHIFILFKTLKQNILPLNSGTRLVASKFRR